MHFTPEEMVDFVKNHLGPKLEADGQDVKILAYDQNRGEELEEWAKVIYKDECLFKIFRWVCNSLVCKHIRLVSRIIEFYP